MSKDIIDAALVEKVAFLARLKLTAQEVEQYTHNLQGVFHWLDTLEEIDLASIELEDEGDTLQRPDKITDGNIQENITKNAPDQNFGMFAVPKVVE